MLPSSNNNQIELLHNNYETLSLIHNENVLIWYCQDKYHKNPAIMKGYTACLLFELPHNKSIPDFRSDPQRSSQGQRLNLQTAVVGWSHCLLFSVGQSQHHNILLLTSRYVFY